MLSLDKATPNRRPMPRKLIDYRYGMQGNHKADLVEMNDRHSTVELRTIKADLSIEGDLDIIYKHEYAGTVGDCEKLRKRLLRYFDTGVNWDESKAVIFKGIHPPPPKYA